MKVMKHIWRKKKATVRNVQQSKTRKKQITHVKTFLEPIMLI